MKTRKSFGSLLLLLLLLCASGASAWAIPGTDSLTQTDSGDSSLTATHQHTLYFEEISSYKGSQNTFKDHHRSYVVFGTGLLGPVCASDSNSKYKTLSQNNDHRERLTKQIFPFHFFW
ncbi:hypothetical protein [Constantimarinum furrinae]|uniref:hypothetical protein n=1 Tax=Constantimarinum furrinae TaxID=2562285 RepID=UPI00164B681D|nr:hypothetical protein [Constantimarinum furrinae]